MTSKEISTVANTRARNSKTAPGPRGAFLLGNVRELQRDPLGFFMGLARDYGDIARIHLGPDEALVIHQPDHLKHVLADKAASYVKPHRFVKALRPVMGKGLLINDGASWKRQRQIANPSFHRQRVAAFGDTFVRSTEEHIARWKEAHGNKPFDIAAEIQRLTMTIVGRTLFSVELGGGADKVGPAVAIASQYVLDQANAPIMTPSFMPTPANLRFKAAVRTLNEVVGGIIEERRKTGVEKGDLLDMMLQARYEETGEGMSVEQLRDELMTFYLAGHETTANALSWSVYLLMKHPAALAKVHAEIDRVLGRRRATVEDGKDLTYTTQVLEEAMRLFPPGWIIARNAIEEDEVAGVRVRRGTQVCFTPYVTHRDPSIYPDPETFDPDRFTPDKVKARPAYAYLPFSGGARKCIGVGFAMLEMQLVLATMLQSLRLQLEPGFSTDVHVAFTLVPKRGVRVSAEYS
jgi:cytochrome P450